MVHTIISALEEPKREGLLQREVSLGHTAKSLSIKQSNKIKTEIWLVFPVAHPVKIRTVKN